MPAVSFLETIHVGLAPAVCLSTFYFTLLWLKRQCHKIFDSFSHLVEKLPFSVI